MLTASWLMLSSLVCSLQLSAGSFPKPLSAQQERRCQEYPDRKKPAPGGPYYEKMLKRAQKFFGRLKDV